MSRQPASPLLLTHIHCLLQHRPVHPLVPPLTPLPPAPHPPPTSSPACTAYCSAALQSSTSLAPPLPSLLPALSPLSPLLLLLLLTRVHSPPLPSLLPVPPLLLPSPASTACCSAALQSSTSLVPILPGSDARASCPKPVDPLREDNAQAGAADLEDADSGRSAVSASAHSTIAPVLGAGVGPVSMHPLPPLPVVGADDRIAQCRQVGVRHEPAGSDSGVRPAMRCNDGGQRTCKGRVCSPPCGAIMGGSRPGKG